VLCCCLAAVTAAVVAAAGLKARLSFLSQALDEEKAARTLAAAEAEAR
jgi:hypothetical protein